MATINKTTNLERGIRSWLERFGNNNTAPNHPAPPTQNNPINENDQVIEMGNMGAPHANPPRPETSDRVQPPVTQQNDPDPPPSPSKNQRYFAALLVLALIFTAVGLLCSYTVTEEQLGPEWTREGSAETLTAKQVIFASIPKRRIWARFLFAQIFPVIVLELVYSYATSAASPTANKARYLRGYKPLCMVLAVVIVALCIWGWLIWTI